jgi:hypothetical protein
VRLLLKQVLLPSLELLLGLDLLALPLPLLTGVLPLLLDPQVVIRGELELLEAQRVESLVDRDPHRAPVLDDGFSRLLEALLRGADRVGTDGADAVVRLDVVGTQHQVAELADESLSLPQRPVHHPPGLATHRRAPADRLLDGCTQPVQALLGGQHVVERVSELVVAHLLQKPEPVSLDDRFPRLAQLPVEPRDLVDQRVPALGQPLQLRLHRTQVRVRRPRGLGMVGVAVDGDSVLASQAGQARSPALAHRADPPCTAAAVDLDQYRGGEPGETPRCERELLVGLQQDRQVIELAYAVAVHRDDDALDGRGKQAQIQAQCLARERDSAARVARGVVEDEVSVGADLTLVVQQQGD